MNIEVKFKNPIFKDEKSGMTIAGYKSADGYVIAKGINLPSAKNITYRFTGEWVSHKKYGEQFSVTSFETLVGSDDESIIAYLSSILPGVGKRIAERIVERFGSQTLYVLDNEINSLLLVKGITEKKFEKIKDAIEENRAARDIVLELGKHGITAKQALQVYRRFKGESMDIIKTRPYQLCLVKGISFPTADAMGEKTEEYERLYDRFVACANYVLYANEMAGLTSIIGRRTSGSLGMDKEDFGKAMLKLLYIKTIDGAFVLENTIRMIKEGLLVYKKIDDKPLIFLPGIYRIEEGIAEHLHRLSLNTSYIIDNIDSKIAIAEKELGICLGEEQREVVKNAFSHSLTLFIGPPGAGKTTTIKVIAYIYEKEFDDELCFMAPSGRAASRIRESSGYRASTVHSGINIGIDTINDIEEEVETAITEGLVIVDEMSMLDARNAYQLFSRIGDNCMVVLCGDDEQLQSVGAGAVLRDMIDSGVIPTTVLNTVYRQASECNVYVNSFKIRRGEKNLSYGEDFQLHEVPDTKEMETKMINSYLEKVQKYGVENVALISPFKEHDAGVYVLNSKIQQLLNPPAPSRKEFVFGSNTYRVGDVVMQLKNNPEEDIANGDIGTVSYIYEADGELCMDVEFATGMVTYTKANAEELTLAYAYTVHKAQGSEARYVITCCHSMHSVMLKRNILYTAITRAKEGVEIYGELKAVEKAIMTQDKETRNTTLKTLLRTKFGEFVTV